MSRQTIAAVDGARRDDERWMRRRVTRTAFLNRNFGSQRSVGRMSLRLAGPTPSSSAKGSIRHLQRLSVEQGYEPHHSGAAGTSPRETAEEEDEDERRRGLASLTAAEATWTSSLKTLHHGRDTCTHGDRTSRQHQQSRPTTPPLALQQQDSDDSERPSVGLSFTQGLKSFTLSVSRSFGGLLGNTTMSKSFTTVRHHPRLSARAA